MVCKGIAGGGNTILSKVSTGLLSKDAITKYCKNLSDKPLQTLSVGLGGKIGLETGGDIKGILKDIFTITKNIPDIK